MAMDYLRYEPIQKRSRAMVTRIEDAARIVLAETGRDRMTTSQVAKQAGIAIGSVYRYFPDRVAILDRIWPDRRDNKPGDSEDPPAPDDGAKHSVWPWAFGCLCGSHRSPSFAESPIHTPFGVTKPWGTSTSQLH